MTAPGARALRAGAGDRPGARLARGHARARGAPRAGSPRTTSTSSPRATPGFTGALNWYRNLDRNWELTAPWHGAVVTPPALYVYGDRDLVPAFPGTPELIEQLPELMPNLRREPLVLPGLRPLDPAGAPRRGERGADRLPDGAAGLSDRSAVDDVGPSRSDLAVVDRFTRSRLRSACTRTSRVALPSRGDRDLPSGSERREPGRRRR